MQDFIIISGSQIVAGFTPYSLSYTNPYIYIEHFTGSSAGEIIYSVDFIGKVTSKYVRSGNVYLVVDSVPAEVFEGIEKPTISLPFVYTFSVDSYPVYAYFKKLGTYSYVEEQAFSFTTSRLELTSTVSFNDVQEFFNNFYQNEISAYQQVLEEAEPLSKEYLSAQTGLNQIFLTISFAVEAIEQLENQINEAFENYISTSITFEDLFNYYAEVTARIQNSYSILIKVNGNNALHRIGTPVYYQETFYVYGTSSLLHSAKEVYLVRQVDLQESTPVNLTETDTVTFSAIGGREDAFANNVFHLEFEDRSPVDLLEYIEYNRINTYVPSFSFGSMEQKSNFHLLSGFVKFGSAEALIQAAFKGITLLRKYDEIITTLSGFYPEKAEKYKEIKNKLYDSFLPFIKWFASEDVTHINHYFRDDSIRQSYALGYLDYYYNSTSLPGTFYLLPIHFWEEVFPSFSSIYPGVNPYQVLLDMHLYAATKYDVSNPYRLSSRLPEEVFDPSYLTYMDMLGNIMDVFYFRNDLQFVETDILNEPTTQNPSQTLEQLTGKLLDAFDALHDQINRITYHAFNRKMKVKWLNTLVESLDLRNKDYQFDVIIHDAFLGDQYYITEHIIPVSQNIPPEDIVLNNYFTFYGFIPYNEHKDIREYYEVTANSFLDSITFSITVSNANPYYVTGAFNYPVYTSRGELITSVSVNVIDNSGFVVDSLNFHGVCYMRDLENGLSLLPFNVVLQGKVITLLFPGIDQLYSMSYMMMVMPTVISTSVYFYLKGTSDSTTSMWLIDNHTYSMFPEVTTSTISYSYYVSTLSYMESNLRHIGVITDNAFEGSIYQPDHIITENPVQKLEDTPYSAVVFLQRNLSNRIRNLAEGDNVHVIETRNQDMLEVVNKTRDAILLLRQLFAGENFFAGVVIEGKPFYAFQMTQSIPHFGQFSFSMFKSFDGEIPIPDTVTVNRIATEREGAVFSIVADTFPKSGVNRYNTQMAYPGTSFVSSLGIHYTKSTFYRETAVMYLINPSTSIALG